jgi:hypothetical protein
VPCSARNARNLSRAKNVPRLGALGTLDNPLFCSLSYLASISIEVLGTNPAHES